MFLISAVLGNPGCECYLYSGIFVDPVKDDPQNVENVHDGD